MSRTSFLQDLLATIFERSAPRPTGDDRRSMDELCEALISERGEASGTRIAATILDRYEAGDAEAKAEFFRLLTEEHDIDTDAIAEAAAAYKAKPDADVLARLLDEAEPPRQEILRRLNRMTGGTGRLVKMREDLLGLLKAHPSFRRTDLDFQHLFVSWFNRGFLVLRRIDWTTPANILEKIIAYEAVHAINDWDDLRRRLQPADRRCFAFFHPSMPDEPLIFVEVALTRDMPNSVQALLSEEREIIDDEHATTAVFYSISNCQRGLMGISFGNFLIKQVATDLSLSLPGLKTFVTLSPVPGFVTWLNEEASEGEEDDATSVVSRASLLGATTVEDLEPLSDDARALAAEYLVRAKRPDGQP
ncbi:MAG: malonyl-CoA decarboxylase domain-containing protein, partial [Pararhizobium sp.]